MNRTKEGILPNLIIPLAEFFLSIVCIYYLFQMEDIEFSVFSLYLILIIIKGLLWIYYTFMIFKNFFWLLSGICKIWSRRIERINESNND